MRGRSGWSATGEGGAMRRWLVLLVTLGSLYFLAVGTPVGMGAIPNKPDPRAVERFRQHEVDRFATDSGNTRAAATEQGPVLDNFELLGHLDLPGDSPHADVFFYDHGGSVGKFAYVGTWVAGCSGTGVKIVDVNDPRNPTL